jgi:hypothetical protein
MKFEEVIVALRNGKKIKHKEWYKSRISPNDFNFTIDCSMEAILSDDWEIVNNHPNYTYEQIEYMKSLIESYCCTVKNPSAVITLVLQKLDKIWQENLSENR